MAALSFVCEVEAALNSLEVLDLGTVTLGTEAAVEGRKLGHNLGLQRRLSLVPSLQTLVAAELAFEGQE